MSADRRASAHRTKSCHENGPLHATAAGRLPCCCFAAGCAATRDQSRRCASACPRGSELDEQPRSQVPSKPQNQVRWRSLEGGAQVGALRKSTASLCTIQSLHSALKSCILRWRVCTLTLQARLCTLCTRTTISSQAEVQSEKM